MDKAKALIEATLSDKKVELANCKDDINDLVKRLALKNSRKEHLESEVEQLERTLQLINQNTPPTLGLSKAGCTEY